MPKQAVPLSKGRWLEASQAMQSEASPAQVEHELSHSRMKEDLQRQEVEFKK